MAHFFGRFDRTPDDISQLIPGAYKVQAPPEAMTKGAYIRKTTFGQWLDTIDTTASREDLIPLGAWTKNPDAPTSPETPEDIRDEEEAHMEETVEARFRDKKEREKRQRWKQKDKARKQRQKEKRWTENRWAAQAQAKRAAKAAEAGAAHPVDAETEAYAAAHPGAADTRRDALADAPAPAPNDTNLLAVKAEIESPAHDSTVVGDSDAHSPSQDSDWDYHLENYPEGPVLILERRIVVTYSDSTTSTLFLAPRTP